jgi:hypothetical protein
MFDWNLFLKCRSATTLSHRNNTKPKKPHSPPMTLSNMRELGVARLIASCFNDACRHQALIDVSGYPAETASFGRRVVCARCGSRGNKIDVRPNWKEQPVQPSLTGNQLR